MILEAIQFVVGFLLTFFLPGYTLIKVLFPRKEELDVDYGTLYQITLGIGMSIVLSIIIGFMLGHPSVVLFTPNWVMGIPALLSALFFLIGWYKGAYPFLAEFHPSLERLPGEKEVVEYEVGRPMERDAVFEFQKLARERYRLRKEIENYEAKMRVQAKSISGYYERKRDEALDRLSEIDDRIKTIEGRRF